MKAKVLNQGDALTPGATLWVLPTSTFSEWTRRLDWPLNLQITRAFFKTPKEISPELKAILEKNELEFETPAEDGKKNLMIATQGHLPTDMLVVINAETWDGWIMAATKIWQDLNKPNARFFIPTFAQWDKVKKEWPSSLNQESVEIVHTEGNV
jgi:hypothetical protein